MNCRLKPRLVCKRHAARLDLVWETLGYYFTWLPQPLEPSRINKHSAENLEPSTQRLSRVVSYFRKDAFKMQPKTFTAGLASIGRD
jgi:hypothetical protein